MINHLWSIKKHTKSSVSGEKNVLKPSKLEVKGIFPPPDSKKIEKG